MNDEQPTTDAWRLRYHPDALPLAERILARFGSTLVEATHPADGQSNSVWLTSTVVLRMGLDHDGSLQREAALAALLPAEVGYPAVLDWGVDQGWEWIVATRLPGADLSATWTTLDDADRCRVVVDLWTRLRALQRTDSVHARQLGCTSTPFYALDAGRAAQQLRVCRAAGALDTTLVDAIEGRLAAMHAALPQVPQALAHTDVHPGNTVWDGQHAIPIDFEFACVGPSDLDVECIFRGFAAKPNSSITRDLAALTHDALARPGACDRIVGYAVLRDTWALTKWLSTGTDHADLETWAPVLNLRAHVHGTSWVAQLWT